MTELNPPGFMQNRTDHTARVMRGAISGLIVTQGVLTAADWVVTQRGAGANMSVDVGGGQGFVLGTEATTQGFYHCVADSTAVNVVITAAHASLARKDAIIARVYDAFYSGASNLWAFEVVTGTASGSPAVPTLPANSYLCAVVNVAALASSITNANIDTTRVYLALRGSANSEIHPFLLMGA